MIRLQPQAREATAPRTPADQAVPVLAGRLAVALALALAAAGLSYLFRAHLEHVVFIFFYPAVVLAAWHGGFLAGALVAAGAVLTVDVLFVGAGRLTLPPLAELSYFLMFAFLAGVVAAAVQRMRLALLVAQRREQEAHAAGEQLRLQTRTLEEQTARLAMKAAEQEQTMEQAEAARSTAEEAFRRSEAERRRVSILAETSRALSESTDYLERLHALGRLVVRELADYCIVDLLREDGSVERIVAEPRNPERHALVEELRRHPPPSRARFGAGMVLETGRPEITLQVQPGALEAIATSPEHLRVLREMAPHSVIILPLNASSRRLGSIMLIRAETMPPFERADVELAGVMAVRAAMLIEMAQLYREATLEIERRQRVEQALQEKAEELERLNVAQRQTLAQLEERTRQAEAAERAAQEASAAKSQFLAVMSHELRTPLNAIMGYTDLIQSGAARMELSETGRNFLDRIRLSVLHLRGLIDEVLSLSRIEAGREEIALERTSLAALLREVAAMVQTDALQKGLRVSVDIDGDVIATTDPGKVRQILINLASNAVKFTDRGAVRLSLRSRRGMACFEVTDTGTGIPPEHLERVFEPFTQVDQSRTRRAGGSGLGLSVCRRFARLLGGDVVVASTVGEGSRFTLMLPLEPTQTPALAAAEQAQ